MQRYTEAVESGTILHHPANGFGLSKRDARKDWRRLTRVNPLQNNYAGFEASIAHAMPSDFKEVITEE